MKVDQLARKQREHVFHTQSTYTVGHGRFNVLCVGQDQVSPGPQRGLPNVCSFDRVVRMVEGVGIDDAEAGLPDVWQIVKRSGPNVPSPTGRINLGPNHTSAVESSEVRSSQTFYRSEPGIESKLSSFEQTNKSAVWFAAEKPNPEQVHLSSVPGSQTENRSQRARAGATVPSVCDVCAMVAYNVCITCDVVRRDLAEPVLLTRPRDLSLEVLITRLVDI